MGSNKNQHNKPQPTGHLFRKSLLALCVVAVSAPAFAQSESDDQLEEVIVTGMRQSLQNAQDIKRNSSTFVDSVSASDIGALPDRSVLEAMQRIPGVSIERFAAVDDPDHMSAEGSGAVIRGMTATRSEFNGRDSFTANSGRGLSFQDVSPEMMAGVDVYKNQTADMIEGGIGGTVSLRTRKPFDQPGMMAAFSAEATYGDLSEETKPTFSGLFSNRWETAAGEFGFLINAVKSEMTTENHNMQADAYKRYLPCWIPGAEEFDIRPDGVTCPASNPGANNAEEEAIQQSERERGKDYATFGEVWLPSGANFLVKEDQRKREGLNTSFQWKDLDDKFLVTTEYIRSKSNLDWYENALKYQGGYKDTDRRLRPFGDGEFLFDSKGRFLAGKMSDGSGEWRGNGQAGFIIGKDADNNNIWSEPANIRLPNAWNTLPGGNQAEFGLKSQLDTRAVASETLVEDFSVNVKWTPDDYWTFEADVQHVAAESSNDDLALHLAVNGFQDIDLRGSTPSLTLTEPWAGARDENRQAWLDAYGTVPGLSDEAGDGNYFTDPASYWWRSGLNHRERSEGEANAIKFDAARQFDNLGPIKQIKAGVRWAEREQTVRRTSWGWGSVAPEFSEGALYLDHTPNQADWIEVNDWSDFHRGGVMTIEGGNKLLGIKRDVVTNIRDNRLCEGDAGFPMMSPNGSFEPYHCRENNDSKYGLFQPNEVSITTETNQAAYIRADFAFDDMKYPIAGNVGLRYIKLDRESDGYITTAEIDKDYDIDVNGVPAGLTTPLTGDAVKSYMEAKIADGTFANEDAFMKGSSDWVGNPYNWYSLADRRYGDSNSGWAAAETSYDALLPSLNLKMELSDDLLARFAYAKAVAYPDMGDVRNTLKVGMEGATLNYSGYLNIIDGEEVEVKVPSGIVMDEWRGDGGNTYLQPMESDQYDISLEWYFAPTGSLTTTLFYKDLNNFFVQGAMPMQITNPVYPDEVRTVEVTTTRNGGKGSMWGYEIAYQQFFDFLPSPFDGFGIQATYTSIESDGVPHNEESYGDAEWAAPQPDGQDSENDTGARVNLAGVPLQGQSDETINFTLMYEKYDWQVRAAYNWRSKYLLTTRDVISKYPLWSDDIGMLDASIMYNINDNVTIGLQGTNLTNTQTKTLMILNDEGMTAGRSWFVMDRRYTLSLRAKF